MNQTISMGILCNDSLKQFSWKTKPFKKQKLNECYRYVSQCAEKNDFKAFISTIGNYGNKKLEKAWHYNGKKWKISKNEKIECALDKFEFNGQQNRLRKKISKEIFLINSPFLEIFCKDKLQIAKAFPKMVPKTFLVKNSLELEKAKEKIPATRIVIKPRYGLAGQKIRIVKKERILKIDGEKIVQEFLESKNGIPELEIRERHDLRLIVLNGKIEIAFLRIPAKKRLISNVSKGGKPVLLEKHLPKKLISMFKKIDKKMKRFGFRFYTADFIKAKGRFYLIELNSKPSFMAFIDLNAKNTGKKFFKKFFGKIRQKLAEK